MFRIIIRGICASTASSVEKKLPVEQGHTKTQTIWMSVIRV
jgi:hypothetical protein